MATKDLYGLTKNIASSKIIERDLTFTPIKQVEMPKMRLKNTVKKSGWSSAQNISFGRKRFLRRI